MCLPSALQAAPDRVRTNVPNSLQIRSAPPGTWVQGPMLEMWAATCHGRGREGHLRMPQSFATVFMLPFSWFSIHLVAVNLWLFFRVLTKLVLRVSAYFSESLWEDESLELFTPPLSSPLTILVWINKLVVAKLSFCISTVSSTFISWHCSRKRALFSVSSVYFISIDRDLDF